MLNSLDKNQNPLSVDFGYAFGTPHRLTGDADYLAAAYPRMAACSHWQQTQRARTRMMVEGQPSMTYGLMPRGMGDGGLIATFDANESAIEWRDFTGDEKFELVVE